jgi:excisionase family DNA binding protein
MNTPSSIFGEEFLATIREVVREEINAASNANGHKESGLLTAEELASRLRVPKSWVYEQSRQDRLPTVRVGKYIRFELQEVLKVFKPVNE